MSPATGAADSEVRAGKRRANVELLGHRAMMRGSIPDSFERVPFRCECSAAGCSEMAWMVERHFLDVAKADGVAVVAPGHVGDDEHVIAISDGYLLVRQGGAAAA